MHDFLTTTALLGSMAGPVVSATLVFGRLRLRGRVILLAALVASCVLFGYGAYLYAGAIPRGGLDTDVGPQDAAGMGFVSGVLAVVLNTVLIAAFMIVKHMIMPMLRFMSRLVVASH